MKHHPRLFGVLLASLVFSTGVARAQLASFTTLQSEIEGLTRQGALDTSDVKGMFGMVLNSLPDRVKVYPTENYYYFKFLDRGLRYTGNIRLEAATRDAGKLQFSYSPEFSPVLPPTDLRHALLGKDDGVSVEALGPLSYRVSFNGKSVVFDLNDLSNARPAAGMLDDDEQFIGPVFDDSAVPFFLVFNARLKKFLFILDESGAPSDRLEPIALSDRIVVGERTSFAYYLDHRRKRKILIGVYRPNIDVNSPYDGPFDQLPDNFIQGETLRNAILAVDPRQKGKIDRLGNLADGASRYLIEPYMEYVELGDLRAYDKCARRKQGDAKLYYTCFGDRPGH